MSDTIVLNHGRSFKYFPYLTPGPASTRTAAAAVGPSRKPRAQWTGPDRRYATFSRFQNLGPGGYEIIYGIRDLRFLV